MKLYAMTAVAAMMIFTACEEDDNDVVSKAGTFYGNEVAVGNGKAKSFVELDSDGNPMAMGIVLSKEALTNLPTESHNHMPHEYALSLPTQKGGLTFDHISMDWNPHGHEPEQIYTKPHFDFHFYLMSKEDRMDIIPDDPKMDIVPEAKYLPADYITTPGGVPMMGKHWLDKFSPELNGEPFTSTFIYGSYDGHITFVEPMVTLEYILSKPEKTFDIKQPSAFEVAGYYPIKYSITFKADTEEYIISLHNMTKK